VKKKKTKENINIDLTSYEFQENEVTNLDNEAFLNWLDDNDLKKFEEIFSNVKESESKSTETKMFEIDKDNGNIIVMVKSTLEKLFEYSIVDNSSALRKIWNYDTYIRNFLVTLPIFSSPPTYFKHLIIKYINDDTRKKKIKKQF